MDDIARLRAQMDEITVKMLEMFKKRGDIAKEIGLIKDASGKSVYDEGREEQLRLKVAQECSRIGADTTSGARLLSFLLNESVKIQSGTAPQTTHLSVFNRAKEMERNGADIIHMEVGEPDFEHPREVAQLLVEACQKGRSKYGSPKGMAEFRVKIAEYESAAHGIRLAPENVIVTPGARFAVYLAVRSLLGQGDEVIIIEPAWPAYQQCAADSGAKARIVETSADNGWEPSVGEIKSKINQNTKMIILNYPNNPTGKILPDSLLDSIMKMAAENGLYVLSDEIYSRYAYTAKCKSVSSYGYEKSVVTQSFSKSHAMTGFRIGYALAHEDVIERMSGLQALCITSVSEPVQYAAMGVLGSDILPNVSTMKERLEALSDAARDAGLEFVAPDGSMYLFCRLSGGRDGTALSEALLEKGVAVAPGEAFGQYREYIRLSACADIGQLIKGVKTISEMVNA